MRTCDPIGLAKAILWEEAKGKLRALYAADGAQTSGEEERRLGYAPFMTIKAAVDAFIEDIESRGLHE